MDLWFFLWLNWVVRIETDRRNIYNFNALKEMFEVAELREHGEPPTGVWSEAWPGMEGKSLLLRRLVHL